MRRNRTHPSASFMVHRPVLVWLGMLLFVGGVAGSTPAQTLPKLYLNEVAGGLSSPVLLTAPTGDDRLFVVEQVGRIRIIGDGVLLTRPFADLRSRVRFSGEQGLLSVAFHPDYARNGYFYVNYIDKSGDTVVERGTVSAADPGVADPASAKVLLKIDQPYENHNGGLMTFGPDGMLYIGMGDGGSGGDPQNHAQTRSDLLGDLLRIDVDHGDPYAIPADNPYVGQTQFRPEIWAYGLRNPWRWSFDFDTNLLYIADVGQGEYEEVNVNPFTTGGLNYGWHVMEGTHCYDPSSGCNESGITQPHLEYTHAEGCSITGGYVYRGSKIPEIAGTYFYSDYCSGWVRSFKYANGQITEKHEWDLPNVGNVLSFGQDDAKNLYLLGANGKVYRLAKQDNLVGDVTRDETVDVDDAIVLLQTIVGLVQPSAIQRTLGDVNGDRLTDVNDVVRVLQSAAGLVSGPA